MSWLFLIFAGFFEIGGVISLKYSDGFSKLKPTISFIVFICLSLFFLSISLREIPISSGYGMWTGIGAAGSVLLSMFLFNEQKSIKKLLLVGGIIFSIIGLKFL